MTKQEYDYIQKRFSWLMNAYVMRDKWISGKEKIGYEKAVLACKSVLSKIYANQEETQ